MEAFALLATGRAEAQAKSEAIRIDYRADARCPTARAFTDRVFARARGARPAVTGEEARTFVVTIEAENRGYQGRLAIREAQGLTVARTVVDARCEDVAEALALSTVLAIDPSSTGDAASTSNPINTNSATTTTATADERSGAQQKPKEQSEPSPATKTEPKEEPETEDGDENDPVQPAAAHGARAWSSALFLGADLQAGSSPRVTFGGSVGYEARPNGAAYLRALGGELSFLASPSEIVSGASSSFQLALARPRACGFALPIGRSMRAMPCLAVELGLLTGRGTDIDEPRTEQRFWAAIQLPARLEADLGSVLLLQLEASLVVPLTRYQFVFLEPETSIYDVPALGFAAALRLGATF